MSDIVDQLRNWAGWPSTAEQRLGPRVLTQDCDAAADEIERLRGENLALTNEVEVLRFAGDVQGERLTAEIERLTRRLEGATRLLNAWHFEYHYGRRLEGIDDDTTTWLGGIDVPDRTADQPDAGPQAPIARVTVWAHLPPSVTLYAPGLPPGEYDLYCEPEATAPMLRAADNAAAQPAAARRTPSGLCTHDDSSWCDETCRAADNSAAAPQAPIARVSVWACLPPSVTLYAPGLPPGEYDLYCEPEATAPMLRDHRRRGFMDATGRFVPEPPAEPPAPRNPALAELHQIDHETAQGRAYHETHEPPHCPSCRCGLDRHSGYVIGNHWLESAYERICAGEAEAEVLADYGVTRTADNAAAQPAAANCPDELCKRSGRCRHPDHCATDNSPASQEGQGR